MFLTTSKISNKFTQFERKLRKFTGRLNSKISVTCTSCGSCQQLRLIFSLRTHRISIRLHMEDHNIPLSLFIISVYILSVLVLWNMFSNGHVTVTSCLFLQFDPSGLMRLPKKKLFMHNCLCAVSKAVFFALFTFQNGRLRSALAVNKSVSIFYFISFSNLFETTLKAKLFVTVYYFFVHCQVQSLYGSL